MKRLEVLISTMNIANEINHKKLINKMHINTPSLTINQITDNKTNNFFLDGNNRLISFKEKGLSKSRNNAIKNSKEDILIFADDDIVYEDKYEDIILEEYNRNEDADIICFYVESTNKQRPSKKLKFKKINNIFRVFKISSYQITFKRKSIINKIKMDELFGCGSVYDRGEENIFLNDARCLGLKIIYSDKKIAEASHISSNWFKGFNEEYFFKEGACFYRINKILYPILIILFAIKKHKLYSKNLSFIKCITLMFKSVKKYKIVKEKYEK